MRDRAARIAIVEDHAALRRGLELLLDRHGYEVVAAAGEAAEAYEEILRVEPDVALIDIALPGENGVRLTRRLLTANGDLAVLLYTAMRDEELVHHALDSGARGIASKAGPTGELLEAIQTVAAGGAYLDARLRPPPANGSSSRARGLLSPREREVLDLLGHGLTGEDISQRLHLSPETVRTHVRNAMDKLGAHTRVHAITLALQRGEISL